MSSMTNSIQQQNINYALYLSTMHTRYIDTYWTFCYRWKLYYDHYLNCFIFCVQTLVWLSCHFAYICYIVIYCIYYKSEQRLHLNKISVYQWTSARAASRTSPMSRQLHHDETRRRSLQPKPPPQPARRPVPRVCWAPDRLRDLHCDRWLIMPGILCVRVLISLRAAFWALMFWSEGNLGNEACLKVKTCF